MSYRSTLIALSLIRFFGICVLGFGISFSFYCVSHLFPQKAQLLKGKDVIYPGMVKTLGRYGKDIHFIERLK